MLINITKSVNNYLYEDEVYVIIGVGVVVCVVRTLSFVVSLVVEEVLDCPNLCFLKGRIVGANRFPYLEGFLDGFAGYFL